MEDKKLKKQLSSRHITMLALGGAIGAGLFKGSGEAIGIAGPSVLIAFLIGGLILYIVMKGLGKIVLSGGDTHHGLSGLIRPYLGAHSADFTDWVYWSMWIINIIAEAVAAASFCSCGSAHSSLGICFYVGCFNYDHQSLFGTVIRRNRILAGFC